MKKRVIHTAERSGKMVLSLACGHSITIALRDPPLRQTRLWRVRVRFTGLRGSQKDYFTLYRIEATGAAKYPNADLARYYMCEACSMADGHHPTHYHDAQIVPPLRPPPAP